MRLAIGARRGPAHADHLRRAAAGHDQGMQALDRRGDRLGHQRRRRMRRGDGAEDGVARRLRVQQAGRGDQRHLVPGGEAEPQAELRRGAGAPSGRCRAKPAWQSAPPCGAAAKSFTRSGRGKRSSAAGGKGCSPIRADQGEAAYQPERVAQPAAQENARRHGPAPPGRGWRRRGIPARHAGACGRVGCSSCWSRSRRRIGGSAHGAARQLALRRAVQGAAARVLAAAELAEAGQTRRGGQVDQPIPAGRQQPGFARAAIRQDGRVAGQHDAMQPAPGQQDMRAGCGAAGQRPGHGVTAAAGDGAGPRVATRAAAARPWHRAASSASSAARKAPSALPATKRSSGISSAGLGAAEQRRGILGGFQRQARRARPRWWRDAASASGTRPGCIRASSRCTRPSGRARLCQESGACSGPAVPVSAASAMRSTSGTSGSARRTRRGDRAKQARGSRHRLGMRCQRRPCGRTEEESCRHAAGLDGSPCRTLYAAAAGGRRSPALQIP